MFTIGPSDQLNIVHTKRDTLNDHNEIHNRSFTYKRIGSTFFSNRPPTIASLGLGAWTPHNHVVTTRPLTGAAKGITAVEFVAVLKVYILYNGSFQTIIISICKTWWVIEILILVIS